METSRYYSAHVKLKMMSGKKRTHLPTNSIMSTHESNNTKSNYKRSNRVQLIFTTILLQVAILFSQNVSIISAQKQKNVQNNKIVKTFNDEFAWHDNEIPQFNHLVVDKNTGRVYIGAVNKLYQLSPNLQLNVAAVTGPKDDSPLCSVFPDCPPTTEKKLTNNVNKALLIDYAESRLISCGSLFQGMCTVRDLRNISIVEERIREPVVANNATASTVAFIAPGPPNPPITQVMYVGVTFTLNGPFRSEVPAVSSRSLESKTLFEIAETDVTTGTRIHVNSLSRERYPINYVYGFSSEGFSYFVTTQKKQTGPYPYLSKLVRICHNDMDYYSYTEIPIECISGDEPTMDYNLVQAAYVGKAGSKLAKDLGVTAQDDVLFAVFSKSDPSEGDITSKPGKKSALCVYSLKSIRRKFMQNIQRCFTGVGSRGLDFISPSLPCLKTKLTQIGEEFCGLDVNNPLGGELPVVAEPVRTFNSHLTAVTATSTGDYSVAFIGTGDGHLKKVVIEGPSNGVEYSDIVVDKGRAVNSDILFDLKREHVYVMTNKKLSKVRVQDCSVYTSCGQCLGSKDPYCGWCSLENKCSLRGDCRDAAMDRLYWISYNSGQCTTITSVQPKELQRTTARTLSLTIENLPTFDSEFQCVFQAVGKQLVTKATRTANGVSCTTPRNDLLPLIPSNEHHFTSELSVRMQNVRTNIVSTNFSFFDCNTFTSCTECVSSPFPCDWCVNGHRCTHDTAENCRNDILVTGVNRVGPSIRSGPDFCPRINASCDGSQEDCGSEILVSSGITKVIRVKVNNIALFISQTRFVCQFNIEGRVTSVNAQLIGEQVYCDQMEFSYTSRAPNISASFAVIWDGSKPLDNPENMRVLIYRCKDMADNCGMCLSLNEKFR